MLRIKRFVPAVLVVLSLVIVVTVAVKLYAAAYVGQVVSSVQLLDVYDNPKAIPYIGERVISIMYTDPDVKDVNDPLSNAMDAKKYPKGKLSAMGIANCKDTWIPDAGIRMKAKQKQNQFPESVILLDTNKTLSVAWGLGNCDGSGVVIIIGKDKKIKYIKYVRSQSESSAIANEVLAVIDAEIKK